MIRPSLPGRFEIYGSKEAAMITHSTVQALGQARLADINALYCSLLAADEARDAAALTAVAWQIYGELATTAADLGALRARFRVYAAAPHASGRRPVPRGGHTDDCGAGRRPPGEMSAQMRKLTGLAALLTVASLGPDLPCTDDPELFFAESPDDVQRAKAALQPAQ